MKYLFVITLSVLTIGCGINSVRKTRDLRVGMHESKVREDMGDPISTEFKGSKLVYKYELHETWKGYVPFYLVFNKDTQKLEEWIRNDHEYYKKQQLWLSSMPSQQNIKVEGTHNIYHH